MITQEAKVGLFLAAALALIGTGIFYLGDVHWAREYSLNIRFNSAEGLPIKGAVNSAGVKIGRVEKIDLQYGRALVTVLIKRQYPAHADATARIASTGFIGSKFLELNLGSSAAPLLNDGDTIEGRPNVTFDEWMERLSDVFKPSDKYGDPVENVKATLANLRDSTDVLKKELKENQGAIDSIIKNTKQVMADLREVTQASKENVKIALANFKSITSRADALLKQIQEGKGTIGALMTDEKTSSDVKETVTSLKQTAKDAESLFNRVRRISVYWDYRQRYDFAAHRAHGDLGLNIVPRPGKFYFVGVDNLGNPEDRNKPGNDLEYHNTLTAVMGRDFGPFTLYAGVIRAQGGIGGAFRPFWMNPAWDKRVEIQAEAFDFGRNETVQGEHFAKPQYNAGVRVGILRWLYAGIGLEDIAAGNHVVGNVEVQLKDDDIAYLFGMASLTSPVKTTQ